MLQKLKKLKDTTVLVGSTLFMALMARTAIAEARYIPSESMLPTLKVQDRLVIEKMSPWVGIPERGDILVFRVPNGARAPETMSDYLAYWQGMGKYTPLIKRVIGLPGETLEVSQGLVLINGKPLKEDYVSEPPFYEFGPITIPDDHVFMMGDNRNNSADSHVWGPLPMHNIMGKAVFRFWPLDRVGSPE